MNRSEAQFMSVVCRDHCKGLVAVCADLPAFGCDGLIAALTFKNPLKQHNLINERPKLSLSLVKSQFRGEAEGWDCSSSNYHIYCY